MPPPPPEEWLLSTISGNLNQETITTVTGQDTPSMYYWFQTKQTCINLLMRGLSKVLIDQMFKLIKLINKIHFMATLYLKHFVNIFFCFFSEQELGAIAASMIHIWFKTFINIYIYICYLYVFWYGVTVFFKYRLTEASC